MSVEPLMLVITVFLSLITLFISVEKRGLQSDIDKGMVFLSVCLLFFCAVRLYQIITYGY